MMQLTVLAETGPKTAVEFVLSEPARCPNCKEDSDREDVDRAAGHHTPLKFEA